MALSAPPVDELLRIARRYYPAGLDVYAHEHEYRGSRESLALEEVCRRAIEDRGQAWNGLTRAIADRYGRDRVFDWTYLRLDPCFKFRVYTASSTPDDAAAAVLLVSVLAPIHVTFTVFERRTESGP